jgi:putative CRISPR-associated protein (TIGR02619 family)
MNHHILTTGISLLQNFARAQTPPVNLDAAVKLHQQVYEFMLADPLNASAELNSLNARTGFANQQGASSFAVTLIHTETAAGKCVCSLLEKFLKRRVVAVHKIPVRGFDKPARDFTPDFATREATQALAQMRDRVVQHIARLRKHSPDLVIELNCTGGYKAEVAVLYELGRALRLPVYYLHETFKTCITLP